MILHRQRAWFYWEIRSGGFRKRLRIDNRDPSRVEQEAKLLRLPLHFMPVEEIVLVP
jgi:hypothetical protein